MYVCMYVLYMYHVCMYVLYMYNVCMYVVYMYHVCIFVLYMYLIIKYLCIVSRDQSFVRYYIYFYCDVWSRNEFAGY